MGINGYISFGEDEIDLSTPTPFPSSELTNIVAPFWTEIDTISSGFASCEEFGALEGGESVDIMLHKVADFIIKRNSDTLSFFPSWMLLCEWNNVTMSGPDPREGRVNVSMFVLECMSGFLNCSS